MGSEADVTLYEPLDGQEITDDAVTIGTLYLKGLTANVSARAVLFVHHVPPNGPRFDLDLTVFRSGGSSTVPLTVSLGVLRRLASDTRTTFVDTEGTLTVPAASTVPQSVRIAWSWTVLPRFHTPPEGDASIADVQPIRLRLTSATDIADLGLHILSLRVTFHADS